MKKEIRGEGGGEEHQQLQHPDRHQLLLESRYLFQGQHYGNKRKAFAGAYMAANWISRATETAFCSVRQTSTLLAFHYDKTHQQFHLLESTTIASKIPRPMLIAFAAYFPVS